MNLTAATDRVDAASGFVLRQKPLQAYELTCEVHPPAFYRDREPFNFVWV